MSLNFNIANARVDVNNTTALSDLTELTMIGWVNLDDTPAKDDGIFYRRNAGGALAYRLILDDASGNLQWYAGRSGSAGFRVSSSLGIQVGVWTCVACTFHPTDGYNIYLGTLGGTLAEPTYSTDVAGSGALVESNGIFNFGNSQTLQASRFLTGNMSIVKCFNKKLTLEQCQMEMYANHNLADRNYYAELGHNVDGTSQGDLSGGGSTGTITGATITDHIPWYMESAGLILANRFVDPGLTQADIDGFGTIYGDWDFTDAGTMTVDGSDLISQINDNSSAGRNLTQATSGKQAKLVAGSWRGITGAAFGHVDNSTESVYDSAYPAIATGTFIVVVKMAIGSSTLAHQACISLEGSSRRSFFSRRNETSGDNVAFWSSTGGWSSTRFANYNSNFAILTFQQAASNLRITVDGNELINEAITTQNTNVTNFSLGNVTGGSGDEMHGTIFRVIAYEDVISDANLTLITDDLISKFITSTKPASATIGLDAAHPLAANVLGAYALNDATGLVVKDASTNNKHGILGRNAEVPLSTVTGINALQGVASDGATIFQTSTLFVDNGTVNRNNVSDGPVIGTPSHNGDCAYFNEELYIALSTYPAVPGDEQIAILNKTTLVTDRIISLVTNGPIDPSGVFVESDGAGGEDIYVSAFEPDEGTTQGGLYHYNVSGGDVETYVGRVTFSINLPFIQGVSKDSSGNWYFTVVNLSNPDRNFLFAFDSSRELIGSIQLPEADYKEIEGVDATGTNLRISYRIEGGTTAYADYSFATLFDNTGLPWSTDRLNFDTSDTDAWYAFLPIVLPSLSTIVFKLNPKTLYDNNVWFGTLNDNGEWEGWFDDNSTSGVDASGANFTFLTDDLNLNDNSVSERFHVVTFDQSGSQSFFFNDDSSETFSRTNIDDHFGGILLGGQDTTDDRSNVDYDYVMFFDKVLSQAEIESLITTGDALALFQNEADAGPITIEASSLFATNFLYSSINDATFESSITQGTTFTTAATGNLLLESSVVLTTNTTLVSSVGSILEASAILALNTGATVSPQAQYEAAVILALNLLSSTGSDVAFEAVADLASSYGLSSAAQAIFEGTIAPTVNFSVNSTTGATIQATVALATQFANISGAEANLEALASLAVQITSTAAAQADFEASIVQAFSQDLTVSQASTSIIEAIADIGTFGIIFGGNAAMVFDVSADYSVSITQSESASQTLEGTTSYDVVISETVTGDLPGQLDAVAAFTVTVNLAGTVQADLNGSVGFGLDTVINKGNTVDFATAAILGTQLGLAGSINQVHNSILAFNQTQTLGVSALSQLLASTSLTLQTNLTATKQQDIEAVANMLMESDLGVIGNLSMDAATSFASDLTYTSDRGIALNALSALGMTMSDQVTRSVSLEGSAGYVMNASVAASVIADLNANIDFDLVTSLISQANAILLAQASLTSNVSFQAATGFVIDAFASLAITTTVDTYGIITTGVEYIEPRASRKVIVIAQEKTITVLESDTHVTVIP